MKGGITSGVVYPPAIFELSKKYRFRGIGGASAGAIAAAVAAAAEYGRDLPGERVGFRGLDARGRELANGTLINQLFEPSPETARLFRLAKGLIETAGKDAAAEDPSAPGAGEPGPGLMIWSARIARALAAGVPSGFWAGTAGGCGAALLVTRPWLLAPPMGSPAWSEWALWGPAALVAVVVLVLFTVVGALAGSGWALKGGLDALRSREKSFFGFCSGHRTAKDEPLRLTDWLHESINELAGYGAADPPLTIKELNDKPEHSIDFRMVTTNLSQAQPIVFPRREADLIFKRTDMERLFPPAVVDYLVDPTPRGEGGTDEERRARARARTEQQDRDRGLRLPDGYHPLPADRNLPVIVATRLSLSFPLLLTAVRLHSVKGTAFTKKDHHNPPSITADELDEEWFSDGGIAANFPLSMFDRWMPARPTFGINLADGPVPSRLARFAKFAKGGDVFRLGAKETDSAQIKPAKIKGVMGLFLAMLDTARNARDNAQMGLASYRERVVNIYLAPDEGGLNLGMGTTTLANIRNKGEQAARALLGDETLGEPSFNFDEHRWVRLLLLMDHLERELFAVRDLVEPGADRFDRLRLHLKALFAVQLKAAKCETTAFYQPREDLWCREADRRIDALLTLIEAWDIPRPGAPTNGALAALFASPPVGDETTFFQHEPPIPGGVLRVNSAI